MEDERFVIDGCFEMVTEFYTGRLDRIVEITNGTVSTTRLTACRHSNSVVIAPVCFHSLSSITSASPEHRVAS